MLAVLRRAGAPTTRAGRELAREAREAVLRFLRETEWRVRVRGQHYSGLSNEALFDVRAEEGRDFLQRTVQLDRAVRPKMLATFARAASVPSLDELRAAYEQLVIDYLVTTRFVRGGGDLLLTPLTHEYAALKTAAGHGGEPIGVLTGAHRDALRDYGYLEFSS